jgi:predicted metal-dependent hydrolase
MGYEAWAEKALQRGIEQTRHISRKNHLAATVAYEHYTAVLGDGLLRHPRWTEGMHPTLRAIWLWHAAEECEHKAVAMDTYNAVDGSYVRRVTIYFLVSLEFISYTAWQVAKMLHKDGQLFKPRTWWSALRHTFGWQGLFWHTLPHWLAYFKPGFHPRQHHNDDLLERWRTEHAGAYRTLSHPTSGSPV